MKYTYLLVLVFSVFFLSACSSSTSSVAGEGSADTSTASTQSAQGTETAAASDDENNGYRCERVAVTGTRMTTKYCTTRKQREDIARSAAAGVNRLTIKNTQAGGPAGN